MRFAAFLLAACLFWLPALAAELSFPPLSGRVVDEADLLPPALEQQLTARLAALEAQTTDQLVVVTLKSLQGQEIADYGYQLGRAWGIGQKDKNNGVLLIVAPNERAVRIEVGYGLEGQLTDAATSAIIRQLILPKFRAGDYAGGIVAGTDMLTRMLGGEATLQELQAPDEGTPLPPWAIILIFIIFIILRLTGVLKGGRGGGFGGFGGGGGFRGGGGSFGGGGASGRW